MALVGHVVKAFVFERSAIHAVRNRDDVFMVSIMVVGILQTLL